MENATVMDFHDSPDVCPELGYQFRHTIMRFGSQDGSDFRPRLRQDFSLRLVAFHSADIATSPVCIAIGISTHFIQFHRILHHFIQL